MKKILLLILSSVISCLAPAQSRETTLEYQKTQQPAAVIELPYTEEVVQGAIKSQFDKQGAKITSSKGLMIVKNASVNVGKEKQILDLYFKIDRKSRQDKEVTVIHLAAGHAGENIAARLPDDKFGLAESQAYLNAIGPDIENHSVGLRVTEQEDVIKKADKKYASLKADSIDYQKRKIALEQKIADNSQSQKNQRAEMERQQEVLEALKARRKP